MGVADNVVIRPFRQTVGIRMHAYRCTRCAAASFSAASLDSLRAGDRCTHCGGELEPASQVRHFSAARTRRVHAPAQGRQTDLRRPA
jgi:DNA-directed RNA polymerase subunit RPC12/RpoP